MAGGGGLRAHLTHLMIGELVSHQALYDKRAFTALTADMYDQPYEGPWASCLSYKADAFGSSTAYLGASFDRGAAV